MWIRVRAIDTEQTAALVATLRYELDKPDGDETLVRALQIIIDRRATEPATAPPNHLQHLF